MKNNKITTKRFVIRKSLIGTNTIIEFTNKKGDTYEYDHDEIFSKNQERFLSMKCFNEYNSTTTALLTASTSFTFTLIR